MFGPFRVWEYPKIFRSSSVKKAIAARAVSIVNIMFVVNVIKWGGHKWGGGMM